MLLVLRIKSGVFVSLETFLNLNSERVPCTEATILHSHVVYSSLEQTNL